jgi:hypothetical protein
MGNNMFTFLVRTSVDVCILAYVICVFHSEDRSKEEALKGGVGVGSTKPNCETKKLIADWSKVV